MGQIAEAEAGAYLEGQGYTIICRNYRTRFGEIDMVAIDGTVMSFVEVRSRSRDRGWIAPEESVLYGWKRQKVIRAAKCYLIQYPTSLPLRFDVVGVVRPIMDGTHRFHLIKDAFRVES